MWTRYLPANGATNSDIFYPKTFLFPRGIIPKNFSSLGFAVSEELGNKQTNRLNHSLTDWRFYTLHIVSFSEKPEQLKKERRRGTLEVELNLFSGLEFNTYYFS